MVNQMYIPYGLTLSSYGITLFFQHMLIIIDILCNEFAFTIGARKNNFTLLTIYIGQDICIILAIIFLCLSLFRTYVFKAGFVRVLLIRFKYSLGLSISYLMLTIGFQTYCLIIHWESPLMYHWPVAYTVLFVLHRINAVFYYYHYKRATLRISDTRFYDEEWVKHTLAHC